MSEQRNLRPLLILLAIIGVILVALQYQKLGLTAFFFAGLLLGLQFIIDRMRKLGAERFAFGSILVAIGFVLSTFPLLGLTWDIIEQTPAIIFTIAGIFFLIIGYSTEYFDLNQRIIEIYNQFVGQLSEIIGKISQRLFRSIWTAITVILILYSIISFIYEPINIINPVYTLGAAAISLTIEFREVILLSISKFLNLVVVFIQGILRRIKQLPLLLIEFIRALDIKSKLNSLKNWIVTTASFVKNIFFKNIWRSFETVAIILVVLSYILNDIGVMYRYLGFGVFIAALAGERREKLLSITKSILNRLYRLILGIKNFLVELPGLIYNFFVSIVNLIKLLSIKFKHFMISIINNTYIPAFTAAITTGIWGIITKDQVLNAFSVILLILSLNMFINKYREGIRTRIQSTQQRVYRNSFRVRNVLRRNKLIHCPQCEFQLKEKLSHCTNCGFKLPQCSICMRKGEKGDEFDNCQQCDYSFHSEHINRWLDISDSCPVCKNTWETELVNPSEA